MFWDPPQTPILYRPMWKPISSGIRESRELIVGPAARKLGVLLMYEAGADRFAADPAEGLGGDAGRRGIYKGEAGGSSRRSRASEARVRPTMWEGPTPLPV